MLAEILNCVHLRAVLERCNYLMKCKVFFSIYEIL